jgi:hypothetical protein
MIDGVDRSQVDLRFEGRSAEAQRQKQWPAVNDEKRTEREKRSGVHRRDRWPVEWSLMTVKIVRE